MGGKNGRSFIPVRIIPIQDMDLLTVTDHAACLLIQGCNKGRNPCVLCGAPARSQFLCQLTVPIRHRRVREAAAIVGLTEAQLEVSPFDLSGGQKRRVAIAGVIAMEPEVLILDEPTAGLDPVGREEILKNIEDYRKAHNATIMMVSHSMDDVARLTDRLLVMNGSHLAMDGTPEEVFQRAEELVEMGLNIPQVTRVFLELKKMGLDVDSVYTINQAVAALKKLKGGKV